MRLLLQVGLDGEQRQPAGRHRLGPQPVEDPAPGGGQQPGRRVARYAVARPGARRRLERVAETVLGEVEATELRDQQGQQAAPLVAPQLLEAGYGSSFSIAIAGRTSTT